MCTTQLDQQLLVTRPHFLMFGWRPRLPIDFLFPTHEVMGKVKPMDAL